MSKRFLPRGHPDDRHGGAWAKHSSSSIFCDVSSTSVNYNRARMRSMISKKATGSLLDSMLNVFATKNIKGNAFVVMNTMRKHQCSTEM